MERATAQGWVQQARSTLPECLVGPSWWPRIEEAARSMSAATAHSIFLECHLSDRAGRTDLIARFLPGDRDYTQRERGGFTGLFAGDFFRRWMDPGDVLHGMSFVDMEWDIEAGSTTPFLCPTLEPILEASPRELEAARREDEARRRPRRARTLAPLVLRALYGNAITAALLARLDQAFEALPPHGSLHYVNYLPVRAGGSEPALRAIVVLPRRDLREYLRQLGYPGEPDRIVDLLRGYSPCDIWANVDLDIRLESLGPRVGLYTTFPCPRATDRVLAGLLRRFAEEGLAPPERLSAIRVWLQGPQPSVSFKVVVAPGPKLAVKAYLEIGRLARLPERTR